MKKVYTFVLILVLLLTQGDQTTVHSAPNPTIGLRVMSFNIRNGKAQDGENRWELRKDLVCQVIREFSPDVLGIQEAYDFQLEELKAQLPEYGQVGVGRDGGSKGEHSSILYLKERFKVEASETFWLSDTPSKPSTSWGHFYRRICTWVRFADRKTGQTFYVFNTHMDHKSQPAREKGAQLIIRRIRDRKHPDPFVLTGDFNAGEDNPVVAYLKGAGKPEEANPIPLVDSWRVIHPDEEEVGTITRFTGKTDGPKIDYIFITPEAEVTEAEIVRTQRDGRYPSDHFPVTAVVKLQAPRQ
jgi:endonuclease/exonuclease/phosphatase family metal-dependent hydrolase